MSTTWLADNLDHPKVRILESDEDVLLYDLGHIRGAQKIDWQDDLNDPLVPTTSTTWDSSACFAGWALARRPPSCCTVLGYARVRNYDGSWTEWGNAVGLPIER